MFYFLFKFPLNLFMLNFQQYFLHIIIINQLIHKFIIIILHPHKLHHKHQLLHIYQVIILNNYLINHIRYQFNQKRGFLLNFHNILLMTLLIFFLKLILLFSI